MLGKIFSVVTASCLLLAGAANAQGKAELLWYSQAAFKLTTPGGKVIMIDPWIMGNPMCPPAEKNVVKVDAVKKANQKEKLDDAKIDVSTTAASSAARTGSAGAPGRWPGTLDLRGNS